MPKVDGFHQRKIILSNTQLNDIMAEIPILISATSEELSHPNNHFLDFKPEEQSISSQQLLIKKGKIFTYVDNKPTTKITESASNSINLFGKIRTLSPMSIMQNEAFFSLVKEETNNYLNRVLKLNKPGQDTSYLHKTVDSLYQIIKKSCPASNEVIHLVTMERDLAEPESGKNRLTAEFSLLLLQELRERIKLNHDQWTVELDRVLSLKQRTSRAESYGIHRLAQQALMLYQSRTVEEEVSVGEKVIMVDDHIQAGSAMYSAIEEISDNRAHLLSMVCISAQKNNLFFNIQPDVKGFIKSLLSDHADAILELNRILNKVGLSIDTLTNVEGMILMSILSDSNNSEHQSAFENILKKYDASEYINNSIFINQKNSLIEEFKKPKVEFNHFENELVLAIKKGRQTVPYEKSVVLSDEEGQDISREMNEREKLPWLLFDFDNTLHDLGSTTFIIFQDIIKSQTGVEIPVEQIKKTRAELKSRGAYAYQRMLLDFIKDHDSNIQMTIEEISNLYQEQKSRELFKPKMTRGDFLFLRQQYRIGIITDGSTFELNLRKIEAYYGFGVDGYIHHTPHSLKKPSQDMYRKFCNMYNVEAKPIAYVGDDDNLDGQMARNANLHFIKCNPLQPTIHMTDLLAELTALQKPKAAPKKTIPFFIKGWISPPVSASGETMTEAADSKDECKTVIFR